MAWKIFCQITILILLGTTTASARRQQTVPQQPPNAVMKYSESKKPELKKPLALIGLEEVWQEGLATGCENHAGFFQVDDIAYEGISDDVGGVRVKWTDKGEMSANTVLMIINTGSLSRADKGSIPTLVSKGTKLFIAYAICGSGAFHYARDIYRADHLEW